ncbi:MAG: cytochrome c biogenesis protein ResB [Nitrospirae bacterium]|nr:cytochrome c biogenesis protein ResB [Nitrospirota bacterium]
MKMPAIYGTIKKYILSRGVVAALIILNITAVAMSTYFPQKFLLGIDKVVKWEEAHPFLRSRYEWYGLDHIFTTVWFGIILSLLFLALLVSTIEQFSGSRKKTFRITPSDSSSMSVSVSRSKAEELIKSFRYSKVTETEGAVKFIKNPWGHWGNFLLHAGITIVIASSFFIALTQQRGKVNLVEGETFKPDTPWIVQENGLLASDFVLPFSVRLDKTAPVFWDNFRVRQISSDITVIKDNNEASKQSLSVNTMGKYRGVSIYQTLDFGHAFFIELEDKENKIHKMILELIHPESLELASYQDFILPGTNSLLQTKYFADAVKKSIEGTNPLLVIRTKDGDNISEQSSLTRGETAYVSGYRVKVLDVRKWTGIIFVDITGMPGIFFGFFIIILGAFAHYFLPPREIILFTHGDKLSLSWKAVEFAELYSEELGQLKNKLALEKET